MNQHYRGTVDSGMRWGRRCTLDLEEEVVGIAPPPFLTRFERADEGMLRLLVPVLGGVTVRGVVAAPDVTARHAQTQVNPAAADAQAVLTTVCRRGHIDNRVEMRARVSHQISSVPRERRGPNDRDRPPPRSWNEETTGASRQDRRPCARWCTAAGTLR